MTDLTDSLDQVASYLMNTIIKPNAANGIIRSKDSKAVLDPASVFYGDQERIPATPAVCVEPSNRQRTLQGVSFRTDNQFTAYVMCYHNAVQDNQVTRQQVQQISEVIEYLVHQDPRFGGLLIHCFCELNESGYVFRQNTMYRTNRITFSGYSKTSLRLPF